MTREQELYLIEVGLEVVLERILQRKKKDHIRHEKEKTETKPKKRKWSDEQRAKFANSMKAHWDKKRASAKK